MDRYEIYCSKEQTWKAFELGAPIKLLYEKDSNSEQRYLTLNPQKHPSLFYEGYCYAKVPTVEQMMQWLEEKKVEFTTISKAWGKWYFYVNCPDRTLIDDGFQSREEALIKAIDSALEYLTENKK